MQSVTFSFGDFAIVSILAKALKYRLASLLQLRGRQDKYIEL